MTLNYGTIERCGNLLHSGWVKAMQYILADPRWHDEFLPYLSGPECAAGVMLNGHSMGGSFAEILAYCHDKGMVSDLLQVEVPEYQMNIKSVYAFEAPRVSIYPLRNESDRKGCFAGARIATTGDPVPSLTFGIEPEPAHPMMRAIQIGTVCDKLGFMCSPQVEVRECDDEEVRTFPSDPGYVDQTLTAHRLYHILPIMEEISRMYKPPEPEWWRKLHKDWKWQPWWDKDFHGPEFQDAY